MVSNINELWYSSEPHAWDEALLRYWNFVKPENKELELELESLDLELIKNMDSNAWYEFLLHKYFRWKYTAPNRLATTTMNLRRYLEENSLDELFMIKQELLTVGNIGDVKKGLSIACRIHGLGTAGASGLLSLMYPHVFATVDQFAVKALREVRSLSESPMLKIMKEESLTIKNGVLLIDIMQRKAADNNSMFGTAIWTPRKIDKILWTFGR